MALYMVRPDGHGVLYVLAWRAWHGMWYGLTGITWYILWPGGYCMVWPDGHGMVYVMACGHGMICGMAWLE